jgi:hypothetical protein
MSRDILLTGSVGLDSAEEVFRTLGRALGTRAPRLPDGETGYARSVWIQSQAPFFLGNPAFEQVEPDPDRPGELRPARMPSKGLYSHTAAGRWQGRARLRPGVKPEDVRFDNIGYADWAIESYAIFRRLKQAGDVPAPTRFQVSLPSVRIVVLSRTIPEAIPVVMPSYARAMRAEIERMAAAIPRAELAIQWDCTEPIQYEGMHADQRAALHKVLSEYASYVPDDIELGYHLCYGDFEHTHMLQPPSLAVSVEITNAIAAAVRRPIGWVHMPVPRDRNDDAYFAPLHDLKMHSETQLYLGLVHHTDGVAGTRQRMETASRYVSAYGIATECGWGRRPKETLPALLRIHAEAADLP